MSTIDLDALERIAQAQEAAYARMLDIGEGVGGLGVHHPDMFRDMLAWDDSSANEHADTVLALIARVRELEAIVNDGGNQAAKYWTRLTAAERALEAERANVKRAQAEAWSEGHSQALANIAWPHERKDNPYVENEGERA